MPLDPHALADTVVLTVKAALAPIQMELAATKAQLAALAGSEKSVTELRDRLVVVETKAAMVAPPDPVLLDVSRRIGELELKPPALEPRPTVQPEEIVALRERIAALETKAATPMVLPEIRETPPQVTLRDLAALSERVAVLETKAPMPGPPGKDGLNGKDGADGFSADDLLAVQDGDRTLVLKMARGDRVKEIGRLTLPVMIQRGVYLDGKAYEAGDVVTWGGSQWHANEDTTTKPGDGSKAWTLVVKRGRDGKDGVNGRDAALPVVSVRP